MAMDEQRAASDGMNRRQPVEAPVYDVFFPEWTRTERTSSAESAPAPPAEPAIPDDVLAATRGNRLLDWQCKRLLDILREECPGIIPPGPVPAGEVTEPIDVGSERLQDLVLGAVGVEDKRRRNQVVWQNAGSELLVHLKGTRIGVVDGFVLIGLVVETQETGRVEVTVPFAVGSSQRLAGMVVSTEPVPRGPALIIDRWGEPIIAAAWQVLVDVIGALTARVGVDHEGTPLVPGAIVASKGTLRVIPQARHAFEAAGQ
jgi:hypothetical protein